MADSQDTNRPTPESLISQFQITKLLKQDQNGRRIALLGTINNEQGILTAERTAIPTESLEVLQSFQAAISRITNLGDNDIYRWYLASSTSPTSPTSEIHPDLKLNLIYPCDTQHIKKYSSQNLRMVTETPTIYRNHIQPYIQRKRDQGRLNWVFNILEGRTEQEDVVLRVESGSGGVNDGFLMLPDLNWDRKSMGSLHLLALVQRRDLWSLRDLRKRDVAFLRGLRARVLEGVREVYGLEADQLKLYVHYQPTYYHFHVHVVNVGLEAGATQATGKAFGLENLISWLEGLNGGEDAGLADVDLTYFLGEESELWTDIFGPLKRGEKAADRV
ncbi:uncharacterized protein N7515_003802 [Penicillium bovifimosum]|uniref:Scavenger mRNA decapping enzyme n=1 Tax=Penicillium bovifimosum TaxID=126998 RepID=A0A9W9H5E5_9EURO|nr:uncharacterized protein N7515_003802 [Penicillium bovifimosum]KAJ5138954.1 hypothetical protein N7515_003802 [Penicillium bovifimosum]